MPARSDKYTVVFINKELGTQTVSFDYASKLYLEYNDTLVDGRDAVLRFVEENKDILTMNKVGYDFLSQSQKESIVDVLIGKGESESTELFNNLFSTLPVEKMIFEQLNPSEILLYIDSCEKNVYSSFDNEISKFFSKKLSPEVKIGIVSDFAGLEFTDEKQDDFEYETLKAYIEDFEYFAEIETIIGDENNIWGFSENSLNKYASINDKNVVMCEMIEKISTVTSIEEYNGIFDEIVKKQYKKENYSPPRQDYGGGSGGGGGKSFKVEGSVEKVEVPETVVPKEPETYYVDMVGYDWAKTAVDKLTEAKVINGVDENSFAPSKSVKREEFVKMIASALKLTGVDFEVDFDDVDKTEWYYPSVCALVRAKIINGTSAKSFGVGTDITREDMAVILDRVYVYKGITLENKSKPVFKDENLMADYAYESVKKLAGLGIISGYTDGSFNAKGSLTRAEAAVVIHNFFDTAGLLN